MERFIATVGRIGPERWAQAAPDRWSPGKEVEHVVEGMALHRWVVRLSIGERAGPRPAVERKVMTARRSADELVEALRDASESCARLVEGLNGEQLDLLARPTRSRTVERTIERVMIGHVETHRQQIERALRT